MEDLHLAHVLIARGWRYYGTAGQVIFSDGQVICTPREAAKLEGIALERDDQEAQAAP